MQPNLGILAFNFYIFDYSKIFNNLMEFFKFCKQNNSIHIQ